MFKSWLWLVFHEKFWESYSLHWWREHQFKCIAAIWIKEKNTCKGFRPVSVAMAGSCWPFPDHWPHSLRFLSPEGFSVFFALWTETKDLALDPNTAVYWCMVLPFKASTSNGSGCPTQLPLSLLSLDTADMSHLLTHGLGDLATWKASMEAWLSRLKHTSRHRTTLLGDQRDSESRDHLEVALVDQAASN